MIKCKLATMIDPHRHLVVFESDVSLFMALLQLLYNRLVMKLQVVCSISTNYRVQTTNICQHISYIVIITHLAQENSFVKSILQIMIKFKEVNDGSALYSLWQNMSYFLSNVMCRQPFIQLNSLFILTTGLFRNCKLPAQYLPNTECRQPIFVKAFLIY